MPPVFGNRVLRRRAFLRSTLAVAGLTAIGSLVQACAPAASPTPTPAPKPTEAAKPAPSTAKVTGKLSVIQFTDWHPDHNKYVNGEITAWAKDRGYPLDLSYVEGYVGAGNLIQKLTAAVQAGDAPDAMDHTLSPSELRFLGIVDDTDALTKDLMKKHGKIMPVTQRRCLLDGKWWAVPYYSRAGGWWVRTKAFKDVGIDPLKDLDSFEKFAEACLKASKPDKELYGWGATANRSGDGETVVSDLVLMSGAQLTDETGQLVVLNKDPYREYAVSGLMWLKGIFTDAKWKPMLPPGILSWTDTSNNEAYLAGKILFTSNAGTLFAKAVFDKNSVWEDTYLIVRPKGVGPKARSMDGGDGARWFLFKGSKNKDAAFEMMDAMLEKPRQTQVFKISTGYAYPNYEWGWEEEVVTSTEPAKHVTPQWKKIAWDTAGYTGTEWPGPPTAQAQSLANSNFWTDLFGEILGGKSVEKAVEDGHNRAVRVFKEFGAKGA